MKIIKIILILCLMITSSCGYKIINKIENSKFEIVDIVYSGDPKINRKLNLFFERFFDNNEANKFFKLKSTNQIIKQVTSKDTAGNESSFSLEIIVTIEVYESEELINNFNINRKVNYNNLDSQFELKQYEKTLVDDLVNLILIDIGTNLSNIK